MIYIDASRYANTQKRTGVENYSYHLINELVRQYGDEIVLISPKKIPLPVRQKIIPFRRMWTLIRLSWEIWRDNKIDNLFVPSHVLPLIRPKRTVITIHDVVFKYSPKSYSPLSRIYLNWATKFAVNRATNIITPSEATRQDLIRFYKADADKIKVVPLGIERENEINAQNDNKTLEKWSLASSPYFLYIGRIEYKKNTDTLIRAFAEFARHEKTVKLVLAGFPGQGGKAILRDIPQEIKDRIILPGYVDEAAKRTLLKNSRCFIFPSRYEGFGIPLLEAMAVNIPIIASSIPSSEEVAEDSIFYFEKENHHQLAKLMQQMMEKKPAKEVLSNRYQRILKKYSWPETARNIFACLTDKSLCPKK